MVLNPVISKLAGKLVVLASASPRRLEILQNAGLRFEVVPSWFKETLDKGLFKAPHEYAVETAKQKALEVARRMPFQHLKTPDIVIGADTIVSVDGRILEKPVNKDDAYRMLSSLSGKEHSVFTGVAIILCHEKECEEVDYQLIDFYEETKVKFADLSESMLWEYINSGEPMDKAGGYGIQALGGMLVECVHGDFLNVVGFPLNRFCKQLDLIYNRHTSPSLQEGLVVLLNHNETLTPPAQLPRAAAPRPEQNNHGDGLTPHTKHSPSAQVKRIGGEKTPTNGQSKHARADLHASEGEPVIELSAVKEEEGEPKAEDLQRIAQLVDGFKASKALFTASSMGVFDLLQKRPGLDAGQVAHEIQGSVKGVECLLEACVSLGLLRSTERTCQQPAYENSALAACFLLSDAPASLQGYIEHCNQTLWPLFSHLESAVREGTNQHEKAFGKKPKDAIQSQEAKLRFTKAMHSVSKLTGKAIATAFDLSAFKSACDLGGCTGAMAHEFTKAWPQLSVTVFDLPAAVEMSERFLPRRADSRVSFAAGDFIEDDLPKADLYILARILHDWPAEKIHVLLGKVADACTPGCAVLIADCTLNALQSLVQTEGTEGTASQYADLLSKHGFGDKRVAHNAHFLNAFIAIKM